MQPTLEAPLFAPAAPAPAPRKPGPSRGSIASSALILTVVATAAGFAAWKRSDLDATRLAAASQPEPVEAVTVAVAEERVHLQTTTSIGTVVALRSITLQNELPGTVREVALEPGQVVEAGTVLVAQDVSVEEAELAAQRARAALAETQLDRLQRASQAHGASEMDVDRARAERDVALAEIARTEAIIARKTIRAPFRARVGIADVHTGQYLNEGTRLTTLQGVDADVHVDFAVAQGVAAGLREGERLEVLAASDSTPIGATIVALDSRIDPATRNAWVRARVEGGAEAFAPGAAVRVRVPVGSPREAVAVPVSALRKGPGGDHVFVIEPDEQGRPRAHVRAVESGAVHDDEVVIHAGLAAGERVAASGSFKLRESVLVAIAGESGAAAGEER